MTRRAIALVAAAVALVAGCHREGVGWHPDSRYAPSLRPAFGVRATNGQLQIWTGSRCADVTRVTLAFVPSSARLVLTPRTDHPAAVERLTLGGPYPPGLKVAQPLPEAFDWRSEASLELWVDGVPGGWGSSTDLTEVTDGSARHPEDTYWFQDVGWLNPAEVASQDGKTFLATCTPDPANKSEAAPIWRKQLG